MVACDIEQSQERAKTSIVEAESNLVSESTEFTNFDDAYINGFRLEELTEGIPLVGKLENGEFPSMLKK